MFEAVLFDLDNTLIQNPDRPFAFAFIKCMDEYFKNTLQISGVSSAFRKGIQRISKHSNPKTNTDVIIETIFDEFKTIDHQKLYEVYMGFYTEAYPSLKTNITPVNAAKPLINYLLAQRKTIIIATNPLYPRTAIEQRLSWAGLEAYLDDFLLMTNSDNMHVSKPNPEYYAEILRKTTISAEQCIMVGDSLRNDIEPAHKIGIKTYHIQTPSTLSKFYEHVQQKINKQTKL